MGRGDKWWGGGGGWVLMGWVVREGINLNVPVRWLN